jgi:hypothetical protein
VRRWVLLGVLPLLLGACGSVSHSVYQGSRAPVCEYLGRAASPTVVLAAQAVPSATLVPCITRLPAGWGIQDVSIHRGRASFTLDSDRAGVGAVIVTLSRYCSLPRVTRQPTDEPGTRRFEQVDEFRPGVSLSATRFYLFPGGCVTYRLRFTGSERGEPLGETNLALSFVTRDAVGAGVRAETGGRAELDP